MKIIFLFLFAIQCFRLFSQDFYEYNKIVIKAQNKIIENDFDSSKYYYNKAFSLVYKPFPKDILNLANVYYHIDSIEMCENLIKKSISNGSYYIYVKKKFKRKINSQKFWNECEKISDSVLTKQRKDTLYTILAKLIQEDQNARKSFFEKKKKIILTDSVNYTFLKKIITENNYPGYQTVGTYNLLDICSVFLLHIKFPQYEKIIKNGLKKGEVTPQMASFIYVRQYQFINRKSCPILPDFLNETYTKYTGIRYKEVLKMGFNFSILL